MIAIVTIPNLVFWPLLCLLIGIAVWHCTRKSDDYHEGYESALRGFTRHANPHRYGSIPWEDWKLGFDAGTYDLMNSYQNNDE